MTNIFNKAPEGTPLEPVIADLEAILNGRETVTGTNETGTCTVKKEYGVYQITTVVKDTEILFMVDPRQYVIRTFKKGISSGTRRKRRYQQAPESAHEYVPADIDSISALDILRNKLAEFQF